MEEENFEAPQLMDLLSKFRPKLLKIARERNIELGDAEGEAAVAYFLAIATFDKSLAAKFSTWWLCKLENQLRTRDVLPSAVRFMDSGDDDDEFGSIEDLIGSLDGDPEAILLAHEAAQERAAKNPRELEMMDDEDELSLVSVSELAAHFKVSKRTVQLNRVRQKKAVWAGQIDMFNGGVK